MRLFGPDGELLERRSRVAHYHIMYDSVVHWKVVYETQTLAYQEVKRIGEESEPNTEWYEEGPVLIETPLPGRTGLHRVLLQVVPCYLSKCRTQATEIHNVPTANEHQ